MVMTSLPVVRPVSPRAWARAPSARARRFREETGLGPGRWLTQQRLRRARHLLESSDLPVERVAHEVGFATATSLRRHLAAEAGVAPSAYRRTFRASGPVGGGVGEASGPGG